METPRSHEVANSEDLCVSRWGVFGRYSLGPWLHGTLWKTSTSYFSGCHLKWRDWAVFPICQLTADNSVTFLVPKLSAASCVSGIGKTWSVWSSLQPCTWQQCKLRMPQKPPKPLGFLSLDCDVERLRRKPYSRKGCWAQTGTQLPVLFFLFLSWHMQGFTALHPFPQKMLKRHEAFWKLRCIRLHGLHWEVSGTSASASILAFFVLLLQSAA